MVPFLLVLALVVSMILSVALTPPAGLARTRARPRRASALLLALTFIAMAGVLVAPTLSLSSSSAAIVVMAVSGVAAGIVISLLSYSIAVDLRYHLSKIIPVAMRTDYGAPDGSGWVRDRWVSFRDHVFVHRSRPLLT